MKHILVAILLLFAMSWQFAVAQTTPLPCSATDIDIDDDGLIEICDLEGLNAIRYQLDGTGYRATSTATLITAGCPTVNGMEKCNGYELTRDLDFNDDASYSSTANKVIWTVADYEDSADNGWQPIGYLRTRSDNKIFNSIFDGNGYTISNLMINRPNTASVGLFGIARNSILNISLLNVDIEGNNWVGSLVGLSIASITNSTATGSVKGRDVFVGGLVGRNDGSITNSYATGSVEGDVFVGGLVGVNLGGSIANSYATGSVEGYSFVGGLVGQNVGSVTNSYATGSVDGHGSVGGLVGENNSSITDGYATGSVAGNFNVGGLVGYNSSIGTVSNSTATGSVKGNERVGGLVGQNVGSVTNSYATGSVAGNSNVGGLIGYSGGLFGLSSPNTAVSNSTATGSVAGNSNVGGLIGRNIARVDKSYASGDVLGRFVYAGGLIGRNSGDISKSQATGNVQGSSHAGGLVAENLGNITDSHAAGDVVGANYTGGLVGTNGDGNSRGNIINSYAAGDVVGTDNTGGLVGVNYNGCNIINSYAEGDIGGNNFVGGLVGSNYLGANIINSYAEGDIGGNNFVGGLVGFNIYGRIANSTAIGNVKGNERVGGLAGQISGNITDIYAAGDVTGNVDVGGLVGVNSYGTINNGYAIGDVSGNVDVGGLVGGSFNDIVKNSYWDIETSGISTSAGGTPKTTVELQMPTEAGRTATELYYGWSADNWHFGTETQYPALRYTEGFDANNPACGSAADLPDCDALLSGQRLGLATLSLLGGPILLPSFSTEVRDYRVINSSRLGHIQLIPTAVNSSATITIFGSEGFSITVASGTTSSAIPLNTTATTLITVEVAAEDGRLVAYRLDVNNSTFNEGERIVLDGEAIYGTNNGSLSYRWTQASGPSLGIAANQALLDIKLRDDLIDKTRNATRVVLRLEVSEAGTVIAREDIALTITKVDNGFIRLSAAPTLQGAILTAPEIDLSADPDGAGSLNADSYQWQVHAAGSRSWVDVGSQAKTYEIPTNTAINTDYRVQFSYSDGQGYVRHLVSQMFTYRLDIDVDDDGLIDINDLEDLNAVRYQLDGSGYNVSNSTITKITTGCRLVNNQETCAGYELVRDLDFGDDGSYGLGIENKADWTSGLGWQPIGTFEAPFNSIFRANGHTISNLYINRGDVQNDVGLFGATGDKAEIADVGLLDVDITGKDGVAGLVGYKEGGTVSNSYVTGRVSGEGLYDVGGLVGWHRGGTITDSYTSSTVVGLGTDTGGLVGDNDSGTIKDSYALSRVVGNENSGGLVGRNRATVMRSYASGTVEGGDAVGGLVGHNRGTVTRSYASGAVEGGGAVGGLVGHNRGIITNSHTTNGVTGGADVGGLAGWSAGDITNSYALGSVAGNNAIGGFIGNNLRGTITNSYAQGDVSGVNQYIGGLMGWNGAGTIINSYAHGDVLGQEDVGGLVGVNNRPTGLIAKSYAVGRVVGREDTGGLVGENRRGKTTKSYWNKTNNPTTTSAGGTSKTTVELQTPTVAGSAATETYYDWSSNDWDFAIPTRYPILRHAVGPDKANPACGDSDDLPDCGTLLSGQLPSVGLSGLTLSGGAMLSPRFSPAVYNYHVNVSADLRYITVQLTASNADATIGISTNGEFAEGDASSKTRIPLNADSATLITISVMAEYSDPSEYRLYVNRIPEIVSAGLDRSITIAKGKAQAINVTVSDADISDTLTLLSRVVGRQGVVELTTTDVPLSTNGRAEREQQLSIKGLQAGNTMIELTVRDEYGASATVILTVTVDANVASAIVDSADTMLLIDIRVFLEGYLR